jgi:hypothetical protein
MGAREFFFTILLTLIMFLVFENKYLILEMENWYKFEINNSILIAWFEIFIHGIFWNVYFLKYWKLS